MITIFLVKDYTSINGYLESLKTNAETSQVSILFTNVKYKVWDYCGTTELPTMIVLNLEFSIPNIMPNCFFRYVLKKGIRKKTDYKGKIKFISPKKAWMYFIK
jgi:hypothetical protein